MSRVRSTSFFFICSAGDLSRSKSLPGVGVCSYRSREGGRSRWYVERCRREVGQGGWKMGREKCMGNGGGIEWWRRYGGRIERCLKVEVRSGSMEEKCTMHVRMYTRVTMMVP